MSDRALLIKFRMRSGRRCDTKLGAFDSRDLITMIVESLVGLSLVLNVSLESRTAFMAAPLAAPDISIRKKETTLLPLIARATNCIVRRVSTDPRYGRAQPAEINDLIIDSIPACVAPIRAMIEAHDKLYGRGSGEAFLLGPYLDVLPSAIIKQVGITTP